MRGSRPCCRQASNTVGNRSGNASPTAARASRNARRPGGERGPEGPRDDVARQQLGLRPGVGQEPTAFLVHEGRPGATQRLGEERHRVGAHVEGGRVELDELQIGEARAGAPREGEAVAGRLRRVGRPREDLADAAGGEHDRPRAVEDERTVGVPGEDAGDAAAVPHQLEGEGALEDGEAALRAERGAQGAHDLGARGVPRVQDACSRVRGLAREVELAGGVPIEARAEGQELREPLRPLARQAGDGRRVAQLPRHREGVRRVERGRVPRPHRAGDSALRPRAVARASQGALGQQVHPPAAEAERDREPGRAGAEHDDVGLANRVEASVHRPAPRPTASIRSTARRARSATTGSTSTRCSISWSERRIFGRVIRFM